MKQKNDWFLSLRAQCATNTTNYYNATTVRQHHNNQLTKQKEASIDES